LDFIFCHRRNFCYSFTVFAAVVIISGSHHWECVALADSQQCGQFRAFLMVLIKMILAMEVI